MQIFTLIPDNIQSGCQSFLKTLLNKQYGISSDKSFVEIFNNDTDFINQYLLYPESEQAIFANFDKAQTEYNETILKAKKRWEKSKQSFYVAKNTMHEMAMHKNECNKYHADIKKIEANKKQFDLLIETETAWDEFKIELKEEKLQDLESVKSRWRNQLSFSRYGYQDLMKAYAQLNNYERQLNFWIEKLSHLDLAPDIKQFFDICIENQNKIKLYKKAICSSIHLRLDNAIEKQNLTLDKPIDWLESELNIKTKLNPVAPSYLDIADLPTLFQILRTNAPELNKDIIYKLSETSEDVKNLIPYQITGEDLVPFELIPDYPVGKAYFSDELKIVLQLNALNASLEDLFQAIASKKFGSVQSLFSHPGFNGLLQIGKMINDEQLRAENNKPYRFNSGLSYYVNYGSAYQAKVFLTKWEARLNQISLNFKSRGSDIAKLISSSIEKDLFRDLEFNLFEFPANTLKVFNDFIEEYGDSEDKAAILNLFTPTYVLNKFDLVKEHVNTSKIEINDDKVHALLQFARLYWSPEQIKAIETLINLLEGEGFPKNIEEDARFVKKIMPLFMEDKAKNELLPFLKLFSENYLSKIAEPDNDSVYRFLLRFHPELALLWTNEREEKIEQKYTQVCQLFSGVMLESFEPEKIASFIGLLYGHDQKKQTAYIAGLVSFVETYVNSYKGINNMLGEATYALYQYCPENLDLLKGMIEKRLNYLIEADLELDDQDMAWFYQMRSDPKISTFILDVLDRKYKGDSFKLSGLLKVNTDKKLFDQIFLKYVQKNFLSLNESEVDSISDLLSLFPKNEKNQLMVDEVLIKCISELSDVEILKNQDKIHYWLKQYGSNLAIESYFMKKLNIALPSKNWLSLKNVVTEITEWLELDKAHKSVFTNPDNENQLVMLYQDCFESYYSGLWSGHFQYLSEWISCPKTTVFTQASRLKWLEEFLADRIHFNKDKRTFKLIDIKIHQANQSIPKVDSSLSEFYGQQNLGSIIQFIRKSLADFDVATTDEVREIISRYLSEREIKSMPEGYLAYQEHEIYQKFLKLWGAISERKFNEAIQQHRLLMIDFKALNRLSQPADLSGSRNTLGYRSKYYQTKFEQLKICADNLFKESLFKMFYLNEAEDAVLKDIYIEIFGEQELVNLNILIEESKIIYAHLQELKQNLSQRKWHLVRFDLGLISPVHACIPNQYTSRIIKELVQPLKEFASNDRLKSIEAYARLIQNRYVNAEEKLKDEEEIKHFNFEQENMVECAKKFTTELMNKFALCENMTEMGKMFSTNNSFRMLLLKCINPEHFGQLQRYLVTQLKGLFEGTCPKEYEHAQARWHKNLYDISHWNALSEFMSFIKDKFKGKTFPNEEGFLKLAHKSMDTATKCFEDLKTLFVLSNGHPESLEDIQTLKKDIVAKQNQCVRSAIFIRYFGSVEQKKLLEKWLDQIAAEQRIIMMKGISNPTIEEALNFVEKLIGLTGNEEQRAENDRINMEWFMYHGVDGTLPNLNTDEVVGVRQATLDEAFHDYVPEFDKQLFAYFIEKFKCDEAGFLKLVDSCKNKFGLENEVDIEKLIQATDLKTMAAELKALQIEIPQERKHVLFFKYKSTIEPDKRDVIKFLFSIGMSAKLHSTLR